MIYLKAYTDQGGAGYAEGPVTLKEFASLEAARKHVEELSTDEHRRVFIEANGEKQSYERPSRHWPGGWSKE